MVRRWGGPAVLCIAAAVSVPCGRSLAQRPPPPPLVIRGLSLIDGSGSPAREGMTIVIRDGRIAAIGPDRAVAAPHPATVISAPGRFAIPGLWDMHVHMTGRPMADRGRAGLEANAGFFLPLFLVSGVTGVRDMSGELDILRRWRADIDRGGRAGPRLVFTGRKLGGAGPVVPGAPYPVRTVADVERSVRLLAEQGADFVKIGELSPPLLPAAVAAGKRWHLPVVGHVPQAASVWSMSELGVRSIEHLMGVLAACSPIEPELLGEARREDSWWGRLLIRIGFWDPARRYQERQARLLATQSDSLAARLFAQFVRAGTWQVPTLTALRDIHGLGTSAAAADPGLVPPAFGSPEDGSDASGPSSQARRHFERQLVLTGAMARAGVPLLAGTDTPGTGRLPGESLAQELELLVRAGLTPRAALDAATLAPARFLGWSDSAGTLAVGKLADLVVLDANPLDDIGNVRHIHAVVARGEYWPRRRLDSLRAEVKRLVQSWWEREPRR